MPARPIVPRKHAGDRQDQQMRAEVLDFSRLSTERSVADAGDLRQIAGKQQMSCDLRRAVMVHGQVARDLRGSLSS
jgi:hypothetical protein